MQAVGNRSLRRESVLVLGTLALLTLGVAALGARSTRGGRRPWYRRLRKPAFQPPAAFGPVWAGHYALQALSAWRVWNAPGGLSRSRALQLWVVQLGLNAAWAWLFFGRRPRAALVDVAAVGASQAAYLQAACQVDRAAAWLVVPSLGWVGFAGLLNEQQLRLDRRLERGWLARPRALLS